MHCLRGAIAAVAVTCMLATAAYAEEPAQYKNSRIITASPPPKPATYIPPRLPSTAVPPPATPEPTEAEPPMASAPASTPVMRPAAPAPSAATPASKPIVVNQPLVVNAPSLTNAASADIANAPVAPKSSVDVTVGRDGLISMKVENAPFSAALNELGRKAKFEVKLYGDVPDKTFSTEFGGMEVERAVIRLMGLAGQKDYFFHYDDHGALVLLETFGAAGIKPPPNTPVAKKPARTTTPRAPISRQRPAPVHPDATEPPIADEPFSRDQFIGDEGMPDDSGGDAPVYIPPTRRR